MSIWIVDIRGKREPNADPALRHRQLMPLLVFGVNAIAAYVLSELLPGYLRTHPSESGVSVLHWCYLAILNVVPDPAIASLLYSFAYAGVCWIPMYVLYKKRIFIKI